MRPTSLTVVGFRSYATEATFDFAGRSLVGIVGPIGSGKSTVLDAVCFALYGKTPTVRSGTRSLINQRQDAARVELWFESSGAHWRAVRALRRKGQSEHALYRHAEPDPVSERLEEWLGAPEVTRRVEDLVGLDFDGFTRSVLLAQNQFSAFLEARPGERDAVLKGAFGFDRLDVMLAAAKAHRSAAERDLEELQRLAEQLAEDRRRRDESAPRLATLVERRDELVAAEPPIRQAAEGIAAAERDRLAGADRLAALESIAASMPSPDAVAGVGRTGAAADRAVDETAAAAGEARRVLVDAEQAFAEFDDGPEGSAATAEARRLVDRLEERRAAATRAREGAKRSAAAAERADRALEEAVATESRAAARVDAASRAQAEAAAMLAADLEALHTAQHADMASTLRGDLVAGEPCPVCRQEVATVPKRRAAGLTAAEKAVTRSQRAHDKASREAEQSAAGRMEAATARSAAEQQAASAARSAAAALEDSSVAAERAEEAATELAGLLGDVDLHAELARRAETIDEARAEIARLRTAEHAAARLHAEAVAARAEHTAAEQSLVASLVAASARVRPSAPPPDMEDLVAAREEIATLVGEQREEAAAAQSRAVAAASRLAEQRTELIAALGLEPGADLAAAARRASEEVAALEAEVSLLDDRLARHEELERQNAATVQRRETYARLADDLLPSRFLAFLLDEERAQLSELGSERFELLSGGRYRFAGDGSFDVVDLNAAERQRSATSLSGGETFLASLALALALADMVARQGGLIDAFFLDEGFGSLDGEHLDLAMEGIERLVAAASGRLVVVVSHVAELRQRIEDLIVLDKDPLTGDSRVLES